MLTEEQIEKNYAEFIQLIETNIQREGVDKLLKWLNTRDTKIAPASTKYHCSYKGGLVVHLLNVYKRLLKLVEMEFGDSDCPYSKETLTIVALFHDISKIEFYEISERNAKDEDGNWIKVPFYQVKDDTKRLIFRDHTTNSYYMLSKFINLNYEESLAIIHHEGGFSASADKNLVSTIMSAFKKSKLALLLHAADMMATCIDENE